MNPLLQEALASIVRWALALGAGYLVKAGIWTGSDAQTYVAAAALALIALGWGIWQKYQSRLTLVTALSSGPSSEEAVKTRIASGLPVPAVSTPSDTIPIK